MTFWRVGGDGWELLFVGAGTGLYVRFPRALSRGGLRCVWCERLCDYMLIGCCLFYPMMSRQLKTRQGEYRGARDGKAATGVVVDRSVFEQGTEVRSLRCREVR